MIADYLLAVEGLAMIRNFVQDPARLEPRAAEMAAIIDGADAAPLSSSIPLISYDVVGGYTQWAPRYDGPRFPSYDAFPDATRQAFLGLPYLLIWEAVKPAS